jgi:hypothetical protein
MVTITLTAKVAEGVRAAILAAGENPHSVSEATGIPYQTLLRLLRGEESSPFNVRQLDFIARHLNIERITEFMDVA